MKARAAILIAFCAMAFATSGHAQATHDATHDHAVMSHANETVVKSPTEPGQGAFAAISEIVQVLMADPNTDWSRVDIGALRRHLVDMDMLVTHADVAVGDLPDGAEYRISLDGPGGEAAGRMVPAHAPVLAAETGWTSTVERDGQSLIWTVTSPEDADIVHALGFFGLMAVGDHHRQHHLGMATGRMMH